MVGHKRGRDESSSEGRGEGSATPSNKGRVVEGGQIDCECTICGKGLSRSSNLTRHMRTHSGDRPYACTTCNQAFSESGNLTRHMRTHTGDRPYPCTTCCQAFSDSSNLTRHRKKMHAVHQE